MQFSKNLGRGRAEAPAAPPPPPPPRPVSTGLYNYYLDLYCHLYWKTYSKFAVQRRIYHTRYLWWNVFVKKVKG